MNRSRTRRTVSIFVIVLAGVFAIVRWPVQRGLDLRGGASLIVRVKVNDPSPERRQNDATMSSSKRARFWSVALMHTAFPRQPSNRTAAEETNYWFSCLASAILHI